ncbi:MAG: TM1812 family CRISPR-associated protein [Lachnospiraceae bacterium]|nr:TM1812 family CRISPR-associated protein [Lachnospiraceae bacterium]
MLNGKERKKKHFIAVLGTGSYSPCTYFWGDRDCNTKFVQEAVLKLVCGELYPEDRITICLTKDARRLNWENRPYSQQEIEKQIGTTTGIYQGLHPILKSCLKDVPGIKIEEKNIATGKDSREIAQMFSEIYDVIGENEDIYFDITHGLRNIPMLVMSILEYAKVTKDIAIGGIYYGAFEVGTLDVETKKKRVPIYDLTFYHTIMSWSNAANSFIQYGHADEINKLANEKWQLLSRTAGKKGQNLKELSGNLNSVAKYLQEFTTSIETGRGKTGYKNGISKWYGEYVSLQKTTSEHLIEEYYPFRELLNKIEQKMNAFKDAQTNLQIGMATIDWCIENHMVQQGYTALEETLKTFLCEKLSVPQEEEFWRETVVKRLCTGLYYVIERDRSEADSKLAEWKAYIQKEKSAQEQIETAMKKGTELFHMIVEKEEHKKFIKLMNTISLKRNDINHFGFTDHTATAGNLKKDLIILTGEFREIQKKWDVSI